MTLINNKQFQFEPFNHLWTFLKQSVDATLEDVLLSNDFEAVTLPHDYLIYQTTDLYESSSGWYKKQIEITNEEETLFLLHFDGVYQDATIYINQVKAYHWQYGYTSFDVDMTPYLQSGLNEIIVQVRYQSPNSRWYSGAGIYRDVHLIKKHKNYHFVEDGIYVSVTKHTNHWSLDIDCEHHVKKTALIVHELRFKNQVIATQSNNISDNRSTQQMNLDSPHLWSHESPHLYTLTTSLLVDGVIYDQVVQKIGFKDVVMDPSKGLFVNGKYTKLNGVCEHHDLGAFGAAYQRPVMKERLLHLKNMGVNAIRTAHNPASSDFMELCDELGFYVIDELLDVWERPKTKYDYARHFEKWIKKDVEQWIKRDRNHVSVLLWSIGNEILDTHVSSRGQDLTRLLQDLVERYDYKQNAPVTIASNFMPWEGAQACADIVKYVGYNYTERLYHKHHTLHPDWIIYGSETASTVQSRGIYHFPYASSILADDDKQCSALGNSVTSWGAKSVEQCITSDRDAPFSLGTFIWTGHDYIGEPTPYDTKNSYFGQIDTAGFEKDTFYIYQASWRSFEEYPMIHIFPYWQFTHGQMIDVRVTTNAPQFKLYLNDKLLEEVELNIRKDLDIVKTFPIRFEPGTLTAVAFDNNGVEVARTVRHSFGDPSTLVVSPNKKTLQADGVDIVELSIYTLDSNGYLVEDAKLPIEVSVKGNGVLLGLDNGDSTDFSPYKTNLKHLFSGHLKAYVGSTLQAGGITITVTAKGLKDQIIQLASEEVSLSQEAILAKQQGHLIRSGEGIVVQSMMDAIVPINRLELIHNGLTIFDPSNTDATIRVNTYPSNATEQEITFQIVNQNMVPTGIAQILKKDDMYILKAIADGTFILRATVQNYKPHPDVMSQLEFEVIGLGTMYKNPYQFIYGGQYDSHQGVIGSAREKGLSTGMDEPTKVTYKDIDFGPIGSNQVTVSIFAFESKPIPVKLYDGSILLERFVYDKKTIWNVYQEHTFRLSKKLTGIHTLTFELEPRLHFKGFNFFLSNKAYTKLSILDSDHYYGDTFQTESWGISNIGNNVSFVFEQMNFEKGTSSIMIKGKAHNDSNMIRIQFTDQTGAMYHHAIEFPHTETREVKTFTLPNWIGIGKIECIFLPGSNFDFEWIQFK